MKLMLIFATGAATLLGMASLAVAQPAYGPNAAYYPGYDYATPAYEPPATYAEPYWDGTHTSGGASRAYSYWGAQKSN